jgi:hypothetical protein
MPPGFPGAFRMAMDTMNGMDPIWGCLIKGSGFFD